MSDLTEILRQTRLRIKQTRKGLDPHRNLPRRQKLDILLYPTEEIKKAREYGELRIKEDYEKYI
jgi:hypothetical protein